MPRDTPVPTPKVGSVSALAAMFSSQVQAFEDDYHVAALPMPDGSLPRSARTEPVVDLTSLLKAWLLFGPGGAGKTVLARWLGGELASRGVLDTTMLAALDPTNRSLAQFYARVMQPADNDPAKVAPFVRKALAALAQHRVNGVIDFGGGDTSWARVIDTAPQLASTMEADGVVPIAAYVLTPRLDDLTALATFEARGFQPRATALVLNLAKAESPSAFDGLRRQPVYRAALDRGAVEVWMPALSQSVALAIERARVQFHQARDGEADAGRKPATLSLFERVEVREWMTRMSSEFAQLDTWLPWA